jgi:hypothetical protein
MTNDDLDKSERGPVSLKYHLNGGDNAHVCVSVNELKKCAGADCTIDVGDVVEIDVTTAGRGRRIVRGTLCKPGFVHFNGSSVKGKKGSAEYALTAKEVLRTGDLLAFPETVRVTKRAASPSGPASEDASARVS